MWTQCEVWLQRDWAPSSPENIWLVMSRAGRAELIRRAQWLVGKGPRKTALSGVGYSHIQCLHRDQIISITTSFACLLELGGVALRPQATLGLQQGVGIWQKCESIEDAPWVSFVAAFHLCFNK